MNDQGEAWTLDRFVVSFFLHALILMVISYFEFIAISPGDHLLTVCIYSPPPPPVKASIVLLQNISPILLAI